MCRIVGVDDPKDFPGEYGYWWKDKTVEPSANQFTYLVIDTFCTELAKAREILFGNATNESGEPMEQFTGIDKLLTKALPQLQKFFSEQNNTVVVFLMILEIIQTQRFVEEQGEGKWLQPLKDSLGETLYEQVLEAGAA
jgi:hypothetical protein